MHLDHLSRLGRLGRLCLCTAVALLLFVGTSLYTRVDRILPVVPGWRQSSPSEPSVPSVPSASSSPPSLPSSIVEVPITKEQYIDAVLRSPVEGLLDPRPIRQKCDSIKFQEGLVWHCDAVVGGIGNVNNMWLNCMRYAIEAGATTVILPRLGKRSDNLIDLGGGDSSVDLSTLFDVDYFLASWKEVCPQMRAVVSEDEVPNLPPPTSPWSPHLMPQNVKKFDMRKYLLVNPEGWREAMDAWLVTRIEKAVAAAEASKEKGGQLEGPASLANMSAAHPVRVHQRMVLGQWNRELETPAFGLSFGRLFRFPLQTRRIAGAALFALEARLGRPVVADALMQPDSDAATATVTSLGPGRLAPNGFMGVHMRVAADAVAAGWPGYEAQAPFFLAEAKKRNFTTIFLASGSAENIARFRSEAEAQGITVLIKEDLLSASEVAELKALSWDQQALVDFDILLRSTWMSGFVRSSFSWSLALRRSILPEAGPSQVTPELGDEYRDNLTAVVGRHPNINPEGMWP